MVICIKRVNCFMQIYHFKIRELKNVEKLVEHLQFKPVSPIRMDWECAFLYNV